MDEYEGPGWRLARDSSRTKYSFLIGGKGWSIELTEEEWVGLAQLVNDLLDEYKKIIDQLMDEESIQLEIERGSWWGSLEGNKIDWDLFVIFKSDSNDERGFEGFWPAPASISMAKRMRKMWDCWQ